MATRGSALSRTLKYFREADIDEARVAAMLVEEIVERRLADVPKTTKAPAAKRMRKAKSQGAALPTNGAAETLADA